MIRRREFITGLVGAAVVPALWLRAAQAQQRNAIARIGFLAAPSASEYARRISAFRLGLRDLGYVEGTNMTLEYRFAEGHYDRLPALAAELVAAKADVIVTAGTPGTLAAKQATAIIPIVMAIIGDPVAVGAVAAVARPGGNVTGQSFFAPEIGAKRIEMLKEAMPQLTRTAVLLNPDNAASMGPSLHALEVAAQTLRMELRIVGVRGVSEFEAAFDRIEQENLAAVVLGDDDAMLVTNAGAIAALATKRHLVSIGPKELVQGGGVMSYGIDFDAAFRRAAAFVDKILKGTKPADLPIEQAARFEFVLNLKTARALGLDLPTATLLRADEVVE